MNSAPSGRIFVKLYCRLSVKTATKSDKCTSTLHEDLSTFYTADSNTQSQTIKQTAHCYVFFATMLVSYIADSDTGSSTAVHKFSKNLEATSKF